MIKRRKKVKSSAKPASEAQKRARERNWNKGQIMSMRTVSHNIRKAKTTTSSERLSLAAVINKLDYILQNWKKP